MGSANLAGSSGSATFQIAKALSTTTVTCTAGPHVFDGDAQTPCSAVAGRAGGSTVPVAVDYSCNVDAGTASAFAAWAGDANHLGSSDSATFTIDRAPVTMTAGGYGCEFDGAAHPVSACVVSGAYVAHLRQRSVDGGAGRRLRRDDAADGVRCGEGVELRGVGSSGAVGGDGRPAVSVGRQRIDGGQCRVATLTGVADYTLDGATEAGHSVTVTVTDCAGVAGDRIEMRGPGVFGQVPPSLVVGGVLIVTS